MFIELLDVYTIGRFRGSLFFNSERRLHVYLEKINHLRLDQDLLI